MNRSGKTRSLFAAITVAAAALAAMTAGTARAEEAALVNGAHVDGAAPGEWTHDWDAAVAGAKASGKPLFVNFTGSDWCGWCKLLKRQVFSQPEWCAWASNHVFLVHLDFPKDKALVPEKYRERNRELARRYKVGGYPTCYLLDPATLDPVGRFGASRDANAKDFVKKVSAAMPDAKKDAKPEGAAPRRPDGPEPARPSSGEPVFQIENGVLFGAKSGDSEEIVVPEGIKTVCLDGFTHGLTKTLTIPEGVESLSRRSGGYVPGARLETVRLPASVTNISVTAFDGHWRRLRKIEIASGSPFAMKDGCLVDTRDSSLVFALPGRERIVVPDGVKVLGNWSFNANDVREIVVPEGVVKIGRGTFKDCRSLESLTLPSSVEEIGKEAFAYCGKLSRIDVSPSNPRFAARDGFLVDGKTGTLLRAFGTHVRVTIPDAVGTIGESAFSFMDSLVSVTIPATVRKIEDGAFAYCKNLEELLLPERLDFYDSHFIMGCAKLREIRLPAGLASIGGNYSFGGCSALRELVLPEGVRTIGGGGLGAVCECENLERIFIPASVSRISGGTFNKNPKLATFDIHPDNRDFRSEDGVLFSKDGKRLVRCPETKKGVYDIPQSVTKIDSRAFSGCCGLTEIRIPEGVAEIGWGAFEKCPAKTNRVSSVVSELRRSQTNFFETTTFDLGDGVSLEMIHCPRISPDYWMGKYETTQEQWRRVMGNNPSHFQNKPKNPVENVSWIDCQEFVDKLNKLEAVKSRGMVFMLPSEKDWRTACLAGAPESAYRCKLPDGTQITSSTLSMVARYNKDWDEGPVQVGSFLPNAWGLYDMHGNVWEWTQAKAGNNRVYCGGGYFLVNGAVNVSSSGGGDPMKRNREIGFRLAAIGTGVVGESKPLIVENPRCEVSEEEDRFSDGIHVIGARMGEWTYDWDAATESAKKDGKPILVFFGPDWNGWCKLLKRRVFTRPDWCAWASNNVYLVHVGFPFGQVIPQQFKTQNRELARRYKIESYPQYLLIDGTTLESIGRFGASRDVSSSNFIQKISAAMRDAKTKTGAPAKQAAGRSPSGAVTGTAGKLPVGKLPSDGRISWFDFSESATDKVSSGRSFDCRNVSLEDGAMRFNGVYVHSAEGRTNGCNAELHVPELDYDGFAVCLSFRPEQDGTSYLPLLNFGHARRWFSANLGTDGRVWFGLNCYDVRIETEGRTVDGEWNWLVCSVDAVGKTVRAALNGVRLDDMPLPADFFYKILPGQLESLKTVDTTFWNGGAAFKGDIAHFVLFGRPLSDDEFKAFCAASAPTTGWTAKTGPSKSMYWNSTLSDGKQILTARVDGNRVFLHPGLQGASGVVDLRGPVADETGKALRIAGIGQEPSIEKDLFIGGGCTASSIVLPEALEWIGRAGFRGCRNLRELKIPASVKSIGDDAFADCPALERIEFENRAFKLDDRMFGIPRTSENIRRPATNLGEE